MKFAIVDVQGFLAPDFIAKELAIYDGKIMKSYVFKPKIPFNALDEDSKKQVKFLYGNHHGVPYNYGNADYQELYTIIYTDLRDVDTIYVKGDIKQCFLIKLFLDMKHKLPIIINLEYSSGNIPKLEKGPTDCTYHNLDICACSVRNAYLLYDYIIKLLP